MGKSKAPPPPDYTGQAIAQGNSSKYSESSPFGEVSWAIRPGADPRNPQPGDYIRNTTLAPQQQQLYDQNVGNQLSIGLAGKSLVGDLNNGGDTQGTQDALYRRATQYYDKNFDRSEASLETKLQNQGVTQGSEAYNNAMDQFGQQKQGAYADATDRSIVQADGIRNTNLNNSVARLAQIMAMSRGESPTSGNSAGGAGLDLMGSTNAQYQAQLGGVNANNAEAAGTASTVGSLAMMAAAFGF
jgi:hypothetical protein